MYYQERKDGFEMSGGSHDYLYTKVYAELHNGMFDEELDEFVDDFADLLHDLEWWQSGDYSEQQYLDSVRKFKKKWFKEEE